MSLKLFKLGDRVTCNENEDGIIIGSENNMYVVRLFSGLRHVGDVCVDGCDLKHANKEI